MDYDTKTNLVTDTRVKRYIRDYLSDQGNEIFVDLENENKVSPDSKLEAVVERILSDEDEMNSLFASNTELLEKFNEIMAEKEDADSILDALQKKKNKELNGFILMQLVKQKFVDIRMFGSAFAVKEFKKPLTGPIQINWGYSLNKVELMDSNSIVTIMNDDESTFGKDYRVYYSLLAFNGTINKFAANTTGLTDKDVELFRSSIWESMPALPTRSKLNQYPKLYVEIIFNNNFSNGHFGDLRNYVSVNPVNNLEDKQVRKFSDLEINFDKLVELLKTNKGEGKPIKEFVINKSFDIEFSVS
jgi:CRISPR-associated protein Csh2